MKYDRIEVMRQDYPVTLLCRVFEVGGKRLLRLAQTAHVGASTGERPA